MEALHHRLEHLLFQIAHNLFHHAYFCFYESDFNVGEIISTSMHKRTFPDYPHLRGQPAAELVHGRLQLVGPLGSELHPGPLRAGPQLPALPTVQFSCSVHTAHLLPAAAGQFGEEAASGAEGSPADRPLHPRQAELQQGAHRPGHHPGVVQD